MSNLTDEQVATLEAKCNAAALPFSALCKAAKVSALAEIGQGDYARALAWIEKKAGATPSLDEVTILQRIDNAEDWEKANEIVDLARGQPFYKRVVEAFNARWSEQIK